MENKKIIGWKTILFQIIGFIAINYIAYKVDHEEVILPLTIIYFVFAALYRISDTGITILTLNPFRWRRKIAFEEIERVNIFCDKFSIITLYLKSGKKINSGLQLITGEAFKLYNLFKNKNIPVTSDGVRTLDWPS